MPVSSCVEGAFEGHVCLSKYVHFLPFTCCPFSILRSSPLLIPLLMPFLFSPNSSSLHCWFLTSPDSFPLPLWLLSQFLSFPLLSPLLSSRPSWILWRHITVHYVGPQWHGSTSVFTIMWNLQKSGHVLPWLSSMLPCIMQAKQIGDKSSRAVLLSTPGFCIFVIMSSNADFIHCWGNNGWQCGKHPPPHSTMSLPHPLQPSQ